MKHALSSVYMARLVAQRTTFQCQQTLLLASLSSIEMMVLHHPIDFDLDLDLGLDLDLNLDLDFRLDDHWPNDIQLYDSTSSQ